MAKLYVTCKHLTEKFLIQKLQTILLVQLSSQKKTTIGNKNFREYSIRYYLKETKWARKKLSAKRNSHCSGALWFSTATVCQNRPKGETYFKKFILRRKTIMKKFVEQFRKQVIYFKLESSVCLRLTKSWLEGGGTLKHFLQKLRVLVPQCTKKRLLGFSLNRSSLN